MMVPKEPTIGAGTGTATGARTGTGGVTGAIGVAVIVSGTGVEA